jgi:biofilm protein TabA
VIFDSIINSHRYEFLAERFRAAFDFLRQPSTLALEPSAPGPEHSLRIDLCGDDIFALVQRYQTKSQDDAFWESHCRYADVQFVVEGVELMGYVPLQSARVVKPYDAARDFMVLSPEHSVAVNWLTVHSGMFAIFMPHDAHMPGVAVNGTSAQVKKIVVKVAVENTPHAPR